MPARDVMASSAARGFRQAVAQARSWGWPGALGLAGVLAAMLASATWLPALQARTEALGAEADAAELRARRLDSQRRLKAASVPTSQRFRDGFPSAQTRQERIATLMTLATEHGLEPRRAEFRLSQDADLGLVRYSVSMPLVGRYAQLRAFIEEAQARDPALGLDRVRLRRASANASTVEIELDWTIFMQTDMRSATPNQPARGTWQP